MIRTLLLALAGMLIAHATAADTWTATRILRPNSLIGPEDLGMIDASVTGALSTEADIVGLEAKVTLYPGRPIMAAHVGPPALIERNQPVILFFRHGGLTISADARALSRGAAGETVRVMNLASRTTVFGQVQDDGSVVVTGGLR